MYSNTPFSRWGEANFNNMMRLVSFAIVIKRRRQFQKRNGNSIITKRKACNWYRKRKIAYLYYSTSCDMHPSSHILRTCTLLKKKFGCRWVMKDTINQSLLHFCFWPRGLVFEVAWHCICKFFFTLFFIIIQLTKEARETKS